jgi:hypothetical protein
MTVVKEISKIYWEYRRSDWTGVALNHQANIHSSMEREMRIMNWVQAFGFLGEGVT